MVTNARIVLPGAGDDRETPRAELVRLALPDRAGLLLARPALGPSAPEHPGRLVERRSRAVLGAPRADLHFVELHRGELTRVALGLATHDHVRAVVVCPAGVSPGRTALALAVAGLLRDRRGAGTPLVTCAVCPPLGDGRTAVPHEVRVEVGGTAQYRLVWELIAGENVPGWLAALR